MLPSGQPSRQYSKLICAVVTFFVVFLLPQLVFADFDSSLLGLKVKLTGFVLPTLAVIGMGIAAISFFTGSPNAKQHMIYAILGCVFGFGAQAISDMLGSLVR